LKPQVSLVVVPNDGVKAQWLEHATRAGYRRQEVRGVSVWAQLRTPGLFMNAPHSPSCSLLLSLSLSSLALSLSLAHQSFYFFFKNRF
jgi:hypothetical protein